MNHTEDPDPKLAVFLANWTTAEVFEHYGETIDDTLEMSKEGVPAGRDATIVVWEIALLSLLFATAVIGNGLVLTALIARRKKLTRMYYFILHLCVSDLIVAFFHILPQLCWEITFRFQGNDLLCRLVKVLQMFGPYLSSYVLVATAVDRYLAICHPMASSNWTTWHAQKMAWAAWILAAFLSLPQAIVFSYQLPHPNATDYDCWATFEQPYGEIAYITYYCIANTLLPLVVLVFTYSAICWAVWVNFRHKKNAPQGDFNGLRSNSPSVYSHEHVKVGHVDDVAELDAGVGTGGERTPINPRIHSLQGISRAKIKTIKLTVVVIVCYIICSMPYTSAVLWLAYYPNAHKMAFYSGAGMALLTLLASLNSCVNPWVYLGFNENLVHTLRVLLCCKDPEPNNSSRRFLPTQYSRSSLSDVIAGHKIVNLGNGVVGWSAGKTGHKNSDSSSSSRNSPRRSASTTPAPLVRQSTRTTSLTDGSERLLLTSPSPSVSTITSELPAKTTGADSPVSGELGSTEAVGKYDTNMASVNLVCSNDHGLNCSKDQKCQCEEV